MSTTITTVLIVGCPIESIKQSDMAIIDEFIYMEELDLVNGIVGKIYLMKNTINVFKDLPQYDDKFFPEFFTKNYKDYCSTYFTYYTY